MSVFLPIVLNWLLAYGYPVIWFAIFIASAGFPIPSALVLLAAGAFAQAGDFNIFLLAVLALSASVCGDSAGYFIGRRWGTKVIDWLETSKWNRFIPPSSIERGRARFKKQAAWAVFLTRFLFPALGGVVNLIAGADPYPYRYFLPCDISGEILSAVIPLSLGYAFGASWEAVGDVLGSFSIFALALLAATFLALYLVRTARRSRIEKIETAKEPAIVQLKKTGTVPPDNPAQRSGELPLS
ncbi:MAG TPA: DedA family protein [Ktedonobacteraceae bacterium]|jgi:membrane-associated protein|nr:DedA family protein [Ktedonobacteraceae bacterium]